MKFNNKIYSDYDFIAKVYNENLKEGGIIACILSSSYLSNKKYSNFKKKVELLNPYVEEIKTGFSSGEGVIKDMETKINMIYLIFQKKNSNIIL